MVLAFAIGYALGESDSYDKGYNHGYGNGYSNGKRPVRGNSNHRNHNGTHTSTSTGPRKPMKLFPTILFVILGISIVAAIIGAVAYFCDKKRAIKDLEEGPLDQNDQIQSGNEEFLPPPGPPPGVQTGKSVSEVELTRELPSYSAIDPQPPSFPPPVHKR